ncbi:MAG: hypothetical protein CMC14_06600 [Flavobacteriaceae bacterium]|nr:hypothetical protein [Flavobacteriaceae bacterium]
MFIGTGKDGAAHQQGALIDILGIREGDNIIFYVMNCGFFGIFKAVGNVFYDYNSYLGHHPQYLNDFLGNKTLTYRMSIEPSEVFENPISEWDMMENPELILDQSIYNLQWSWIFKKLNASRGCLSIDNYEYELFYNILSNGNIQLENGLNYDLINDKIEYLNNNLAYLQDCKAIIPVSNERILKIHRESDLRRLFTAKAGDLEILDQVLNIEENGNINYIANEVLCSFSERKIDLVFGTDQNKCLLIELKNEFIFDNKIYNQLKEYARWISAYKLDYQEIIPILIIKEPREVAKRANGKYYKYLSQEDKDHNQTSPWYNTISEQINDAKILLAEEGINKLQDLKVYTFKTDNDSNLVSFEEV